MTNSQEDKIRMLVDKYNDILLHSMRLAIAEDLINLMLLNKDDKDFELKDLLNDKEAFYNFIMKEFLKKNSSSVAGELGKMEDPVRSIKKNVSKIRTKK